MREAVVTNCLQEKQRNGPKVLLYQDSSADLAKICAQHLFISFIWAVTLQTVTSERVPRPVRKLLLPANFLHQGDMNIHEYVKLESGGPPGIPWSKGPRSGIKLTHTTLTSLANYAEKEGLGTSDEILQCMIPVFSFNDRLPNDIVLGKPVPEDVSRKENRDWVKLVPRYVKLLDETADLIHTETQSNLALNAVVNTMEFVYLLALDIFRTSNGPKETESEGKIQLKDRKPIDERIDKLVSEIFNKFYDILMTLWPMYELQHRADAFKEIFSLCSGAKERASMLGHQDLIDESFMDRVGFSELHQEICDPDKGGQINFRSINGTQ